jgi:toxin HigB-1
LEKFFLKGSKAGINPDHAERLTVRLTALQGATGPDDIKVPGWRLHTLTGEHEGHWSINVSGNWRLTFMFDHSDVILLDYWDTHGN